MTGRAKRVRRVEWAGLDKFAFQDLRNAADGAPLGIRCLPYSRGLPTPFKLPELCSGDLSLGVSRFEWPITLALHPRRRPAVLLACLQELIS